MRISIRVYGDDGDYGKEHIFDDILEALLFVKNWHYSKKIGDQLIWEEKE